MWRASLRMLGTRCAASVSGRERGLVSSTIATFNDKSCNSGCIGCIAITGADDGKAFHQVGSEVDRTDYLSPLTTGFGAFGACEGAKFAGAGH